jgi:UPF0755 protein
MKFFRILLALAAVILIVIGVAVYFFYSSLNTPIEHSRAKDYIPVERGSTPSEIVSKLTAEGILADRTSVMLYLRLFGDASKIQAGEYRFASPISPLQVLKELEKGSVQVKKLTIPEGFTRFDIAKRIVENFPQDPPMTEDQVLMLMADTTLIREFAPEARNLEGYLYPSTYSLPPDAKAADIINTTVEQFNKVWKPEWNERARQLGRTPHEIVTIASLVETESPLESERPIVASVIYNRIAKNIPLGIDQTAVYIAKMERRWDGTIHRSDLESTSPYNTRKYGGIPPGPIASVSVSSIEAALNPETTDYIFYVLNVDKNDGSHHFYASASEFERGKAVYQRWLEEQRRLKREAERSQ